MYTWTTPFLMDRRGIGIYIYEFLEALVLQMGMWSVKRTDDRPISAVSVEVEREQIGAARRAKRGCCRASDKGGCLNESPITSQIY